jgi:hypothetical protein
MARFLNANDVINRVAVEVGLSPDVDPVGSSDELFEQFTGLLTAAGQELVELHPWQVLRGVFEFTTTDTDTGTYNLPDDFSYMIDQTGWDKSNRVAIGGPLSAQDWSYLDGRDLVSQSIYASFRLVDNKFDLYPQPPPVGLDIRFEYISRNWVTESGQQEPNQDKIGAGSDIVMYEPIMIIKFLKAKWLEAKGLEPGAARLEFETMFLSRTGKDEGAPILSASNNSRGFPYLHPYYNTADTGYGGP